MLKDEIRKKIIFLNLSQLELICQIHDLNHKTEITPMKINKK